MPERYTGTPSALDRLGHARAPRAASTSAWLPSTISGRSARGQRRGRARDAPSSAAGGTATARTGGAYGSSLPANIRSAWRLRYQRSSRSAIEVPLPAASAYQPRMSFSS